MSEPDHLIGAALREFADQATTSRLDADGLWRAGRRRRWAAITTSVAGAAVAAALVPLTLLSVLAPAPGPASAHQLPPIRYPIQFRQVARIAYGSCPPRSHGLPGISKDECFYFTRTAMTIGRFASVKIAEQEVTCTTHPGRVLHATASPGSKIPTEGPGTIVLSFRLQRADIHPYARLTRKLANQPGPRNQLAIIANGMVIFHPRIVNEIPFSIPSSIIMTASTLHSRPHPGGWAFQMEWLTRAQAQEFLGYLPAPACFP